MGDRAIDRVTEADAVLADRTIDVVAIASYDDQHAVQVERALGSGKHVFVEKPLAYDIDEVVRLAQMLRACPGQRLSSNLVLRRAPRFRALRDDLRAGHLGRVYQVDAAYNYGRLEKITHGWRGARPRYSAVHGGAVHMVDLVLWLLGERPTEVAAMGNRIATDHRYDFDDNVTALLRFPSGITATVAVNYGCVMPHGHELTVYGTEATFRHAEGTARRYRARDPATRPVVDPHPYPGAGKGDLFAAFLTAIAAGAEPEIPEPDVFLTAEVCCAIESAAQQRTVVELGH